MSRFHKKYHSHAHHSVASVGYPDSASDPIASASSPFVGDFHLSGNLLADQMILSAAKINVGTFVSLSAINLSAFNIKYTGTLLHSTTYTDGSNAGYVGLGYQGHNTGVYSVTIGYQSSATGNYTFVGGYKNKVDGLYSAAVGSINILDHDRTYAIGYNNKIYSLYSIALGTGNTIRSSSSLSMALGEGNVNAGSSSYTFGYACSAVGINSMALGSGSVANGISSFIYSNIWRSIVPGYRQFLVSAGGGVDLGENVTVHGDFSIKDDQGTVQLVSDNANSILENYFNTSTDKEKILSSFVVNPPIVYKSNFTLSALTFSGNAIDSSINVVSFADAIGAHVTLPILSAFAATQKSLIASDAALTGNSYGIEIKIINKSGKGIYVIPDGDTIDDLSSSQAFPLSADTHIHLVGNVSGRDWYSY